MPTHVYYFNLAAKLLAGSPKLLQNLETSQEIIDKTTELAKMLRDSANKGNPDYISEEDAERLFSSDDADSETWEQP